MKKSFVDYLEFKDLIKKVSKDLNQKIIIRPHPSDLFHSDWFNEFKNEKNIDVIYDDDISPWILACECLLHGVVLLLYKHIFITNPVFIGKVKLD